MNSSPFSSMVMPGTTVQHGYAPWEFMLRLDQVSHNAREQFIITQQRASPPTNIASGANSYAPPGFLVREAARALQVSQFHHAYDDPQGHALALRSIQAYEHFTSEHGLELSNDRVMLTHGASMALHLVALYFAEVDPGCDVLVPVPTYPLASATAAFAGLHVTEIFHDGSGRFLPTLAEYQAASSPSTRLILVNIFNNPTGECYQRRELATILAWAAERNITVLVDKISCDINIHTSAPNVLDLAAEIGCLEQIVVISSISKDRSLPGFRLGWVIAPAKMIDRLTRYNALISMTSTSPMSAVLFIDMLCRTLDHTRRRDGSTRVDDQSVTVAFVERAKADVPATSQRDWFLEPYLDNRYRSALFHEYIHWRAGFDQLLRANLHVIDTFQGDALMVGARCNGGFNTFVHLPMIDHVDPHRFAIDLCRGRGVQIMPGPAFGGSLEDWSARRGFWTRISFAMNTEQLASGIARLLSFSRRAGAD